MTGAASPRGAEVSNLAKVSNLLGGGVVHGASIQTGSIQSVHFHEAHALPPAPRELPASPQVWVDREDDVDRLAQMCGSASDGVRCVAICGPGGIGKSALAVRLLRRLDRAEGRPQLYVDLRGHPGQTPLGPADVLSRFLRSFGYGPGLPSHLDEPSAWWRSATAERDVAVLADNAGSAAQVRPLLPGGPGSLVVVTSRLPLEGLVVDGAALHRLPALPEHAAVELLTRCAIPPTGDTDVAAATRIVQACAHNPLAVRTVAARSVLHAGMTLTELARTLDRPDPHRHAHDDGRGAVMDTLRQTYRALSPDAARAFWLLGCLPGRTFDADVVAAVCTVERTEAARLLHVLLAAELAQDQRSDDLRESGAEVECVFHDVVTDLATQLAGGEPAGVQEEARRRWAERYLAAATQAEERLTPSHRSLHRSPVHVLSGRDLFDGVPDPGVLARLERRRDDLLSAVRAAFAAGWSDLTWQLADAMWPLFLRGRHTKDWISVHQDFGLPAAEHDGDPHVIRRMLTTLGGGLRSAGRLDEALARYEQAFTSARQDAHKKDEAQALNELGGCLQRANRPDQAVPISSTL
ncbi:tetratricopeptide repeat protein [Streptomyces sp. SID1121]|uniref:tetratricopeptide repeat protein n=1 Tax=Streptomyces sp. SID1121 TaxID=3425888 RepID=UPI0040563518